MTNLKNYIWMIEYKYKDIGWGPTQYSYRHKNNAYVQLSELKKIQPADIDDYRIKKYIREE